jgi:outer membrane protein
MKPAFNLVRALFFALFVSFLLPCSGISANNGPLTLKRAVELALVHSPAAAQSAADEQRAFASYRETRDAFIPQLLIGSGLGDSWGYPLSLEGSAPSLVNLSAQSALFNPALRSGLRAARTEYEATRVGGKDRRDQIIQDTALAYLELLKWQQLMDNLQKQQDDAANIEQIVAQRIQQGIDTPQQGIEARLATARAKLRLSQAQGAMDELRATLSELTGLPAGSIQAVAESVPAMPDLPTEQDATTQAMKSNPAIEFAQTHANAESFRARAEHLALWPSVDFASQYAVLAKFNNWLQFFPTKAFERNNATIGVVIRFPFLNASQHAHAEAVDAQAIRARREVDATKNQVSEHTLKLEHSVQQLAAAKEVADLEYQIAKSDVDSVEIRMNSGNATVHDAANARLELAAKYDALQDANFELLRAQIGLLRVTGGLGVWVEQSR